MLPLGVASLTSAIQLNLAAGERIEPGSPARAASCFCACWGGRTLRASFKDSRPAIERPGITPLATYLQTHKSW